MKLIYSQLIAGVIALLLLSPAKAASLPPLKVSPDGRFFVKQSGDPFFYLGDTAWGLFAHTTREDVDHAVKDHADKGLTVVQAVVVHWDGMPRRNPYGRLPLEDNDPAKPEEKYFEHVEYAITQAESHGLYVAVLPCWVKGFVRNADSPARRSRGNANICSMMRQKVISIEIWIFR